MQDVVDSVQVTAEEKGLELVLDVAPEVPEASSATRSACARSW